MKRASLALEALPLGEIDNSLSIENPLGDDMLDEKGVSVTMDLLDEIGSGHQSSVVDGQEAVTALESMGNYLQKHGSATLGKSGVKFANIAIEQLCVKAKLSLEELPIDSGVFESDPEAAVGAGVEEIKKMQSSITDNMAGDMTKLLVNLTQKRELFNKAIQHMYHRIDEVQEVLDAFKGERNAGVRMTLTVNPVWREFFYGAACVQDGATVVSDIDFLMTEHTHLFRRLIKRQLDWINQHKDNILTTKEGFASYFFNPVEYNIGATEPSDTIQNSNQQRFISASVLPGNRRFNCVTANELKTGFDGAQALLNSKAFLTIDKVEDRAVNRIGILRVETVDARIAELKHGLAQLKKWCDNAYCALWKDAFFDETMISFLLKTEAGSLNERGLSLIAQGVLSLLDNATTDIGQYALLTFSSLLEYVECCMSVHMPEGTTDE